MSENFGVSLSGGTDCEGGLHSACEKRGGFKKARGLENLTISWGRGEKKPNVSGVWLGVWGGTVIMS